MRPHVLAFAAVAAAALLVPSDSRTQAPRPPRPELVPVAETRLVMDGLARSNFRGLLRNLQERPDSVEAWSFVRGQALLLAETGNLLMLRPPRGAGQYEWMERSGELRVAASRLGRSAGLRNYEGSKNALAEVAAACNRCHRTFRVDERVGPADRGE